MTTSADQVTIASDDLWVTIAADGAEMQRIVDGDGRELLWDGDPAFWTGRAPLLFPIVGALAGGRLRHGGRSYSLPKHGFARHSRFAIAASAPDRATLRLAASDATRAVWPFAFRLDVTYHVTGATLEIAATVHNPGDDALPVSFGFHPALRWPLPYGGAREDHVVRFNRPEPAPIRGVTPDGLIATAPLPSPVDGNILRLRDALFVPDALVFDRLASRGLWYGTPGRPGVRVDFPDMPDLGLWTKPGAGYLCIEPWQGMADPDGFTGDIARKPGIVIVAPGAERRFAMRIGFGATA